jgi:hypothetical protein
VKDRQTDRRKRKKFKEKDKKPNHEKITHIQTKYNKKNTAYGELYVGPPGGTLQSTCFNPPHMVRSYGHGKQIQPYATTQTIHWFREFAKKTTRPTMIIHTET